MMAQTTKEEWLKLLYGIIIDGIKHKLKTGEALNERQQSIVDRFPDYEWPKEGGW